VAHIVDADGYATRTYRRVSVFITIRWSLTELGEVDIRARWTRRLERHPT
jgi:hypothetical protein